MEQQTGIQSAQPRNYSLDLLRILAMWMIVCLHILGHGQILEIASAKNYYLLEVLRFCCVIAVNLYVLISSYFLCTQKFRPSKLLRLYLEVVFYGVIIYLWAVFSGRASLSIGNLLFGCLTPISSKEYWFVSAYAILYLLTPLLNRLIKGLNKRQHLFALLGLLFLFSIWKDVYPYDNVFNLHNGYSFEWFVILYFLGSFLRLYADPSKWKLPILWYFACSFLLVGIDIFFPELVAAIPKADAWQAHFVRYNSFLTLLSSTFLFVAFLKLDIKRKASQRLIRLFAPLTFGVYLIHDNFYFRPFLWKELLQTQNYPAASIRLVPMVLGTATLVFLTCLLLDFLRSLLFSIWEKRESWRKALDRFDRFVLGIFAKLAHLLEPKL